MSKNFKFSIVISIFESQIYLKDSIDSIINQSLDFEKNAQLILIDNGSLDGSSEIIQEYQSEYPENILILSKENEGLASSYNFVLDYVEGEYVNFLEANDYLSNNTLKDVYNFFSSNNQIDVISLPICVFTEEKSRYISDYDFNKKRVIDLIKEPYFADIKFYSSFIKTEVIKNYHFCNDLIIDADKLVLYNILLNKKTLGSVTTATYYYRKREGDSRFLKNNITKRHFTDKIKLFFLSLVNSSLEAEGCVLEFIQHIIVRELKLIVTTEELGDYLETQEEIDEFWEYFYKLLSYLDDDFIYNDKYLNYTIKSFLIYLKNKDFHIRVLPEKSQVFFESDKYIVRRVHRGFITFDIVDFNNGVLNFSGGYNSTFNGDITVEAVKKDSNGKETIYKAKPREYLTSPRRPKKFLGILWSLYFHFDIDIPIKEGEVCEINFREIFHGDEDIIIYNRINFREFPGISFLNNYFIKHSRIVSFRGKTFYSQPYSFTQMLKLELKVLRRIIINKEDMLLKGLFYRILRLISFPFMKNKKIWLFMDRDTFADENAEHLFKYSVQQNDDIKKYFIINKDSPDFKRLKEFDKHIVPFKSFKHKFLYLFADKFISSQVTKSFANPFINKNSYIYEGISKHDFAFLQHGVIKDDLSSWIRKYNRNIRFFVTSSDLERDSVVNGYYNYDDEVVQAVGLPRFDNLEDDSKKEILFIPTWRRTLDTEDQLVNSEYLLGMNSFLNNEKLINALKERGYKFVFRPHPQLWEFVHLFKISDDIRISDEPYREMFKHASIMITDYSSVFFDFAYIKKPIIYYQFDEYHYGEGYFNYETMGFGDVLDNEDILVDKIIEYLDKDCKMEDKYKERVDKFFKYNDKNNCKRSYDWLLNH